MARREDNPIFVQNRAKIDGTFRDAADAEIAPGVAPEKDFVDALRGITLDQADLYGTMMSRAADFDPSLDSRALREAAGAYDSSMGTTASGLDSLAYEAANGPLASPYAAEKAMQRNLDMSNAAARSGRGDSMLLSRENAFVQGAANRYAAEDARSAAIAESDARRGLSADLTTAAAGVEDEAARGFGAMTAGADDIDIQGAGVKADTIEAATRGEMADISVRADLATGASDLEGLGLDTRESIGNNMWGGETNARSIARGQAIREADRDYARSQTRDRMWGTIVQTGGETGMRAASPSMNDVPEGFEEDDGGFGPYRP